MTGKFNMLTAGMILMAPIMASFVPPEAAVDYVKWLDSKQPYEVSGYPLPPVFKSKEEEEFLRRIEGSMMGLACGDAMGAYFEFKSPVFIAELAEKLKEDMNKMKGSRDFLRRLGIIGTFGNLKKGAWTDDTSMALCLACSLLVTGKHDPYDQLIRYGRWVNEGYLSSTGGCFDVGAGTRTSISTFKERVRHLKSKGMGENEIRMAVDCRCGPENGAGNGCLMRLAPVPIFFFRDVEDAIKYSGESAKTTHDTEQTKVSLDACKYYGALIACAIRGYPKEKLLSSSFCDEFSGLKGLCDEVREISKTSYRGMQISEKWRANGNGYVLISLEAALWAFANDEGSFEKGVMDIIKLLGYDTDTIAAIYGQLAGACYGIDGIPSDWGNDLMYGDFIKCISSHLYYAGAQKHE